MKQLLFISLYCFVSGLWSQSPTNDFNRYKPLLCEGEMPSDFKNDIKTLVEATKQIEKESVDKEKEIKVGMAEYSNFELKKILFSGTVLYGDALTQYVSHVADSALKSEPELRKQLHFYVWKNSDVNAITFDMGIVFINVGLLAQIETEAQLAFIICHEAVHFKNHHQFDFLSYKNATERVKRKSLDEEGRIIKILSYKRDLELEADKQGLEIFLKSAYGSKNIEKTFDVLKYAYLPFENIEFDKNYFNTGNYVIPESYFPTKVKEISAREGAIDSMSTHPNLFKRKDQIIRYLESIDVKEGLTFIEGKDRFLDIKKLARFEMPLIYLRDGEPEEAFYAAFLLGRIYGETQYSNKVITASLYVLAKRKNEAYSEKLINTVFDYANPYNLVPEWLTIEGESQAVYALFYHLSAVELNILAVKKIYELNLKHKDEFNELRLDDLMSELISLHQISKSSFLEHKQEPFNANDTIAIEDVSKTDKIISDARVNFDKYYWYAFSEFQNSVNFKKLFYKHCDRNDSLIKLKESPNYKNYRQERSEIIQKFGQALNIKKVCIVNPAYLSYSYQTVEKDTYYLIYRVRNPNVTPLDQIRVERSLQKNFLHYAAILGMNITIIGRNSVDSFDTEKFNKYQELSNWTSEKFNQGCFSALTYNHQELVKDTSNIRYLGYFGVTKFYRSYTTDFILFDLYTGKIMMLYNKELIKVKPDGIEVRSVIYNILDHTSQTPDKLKALNVKYNINE